MSSVRVEIKCESCNNTFYVNEKLVVTSSEKFEYYSESDRKYIRGIRNTYLVSPDQVVKRLVYHCPKCGYVQSWMIASDLEKRRIFIGFTLLVVSPIPTCVAMVFLSDWLASLNLSGFSEAILFAILIVLPLAGFVSGLLILFKVFDRWLNPNRRYPKTQLKYEPDYEVFD